ncbi:hypothetical protein CHGG_06893 [Chaetomium globosum CBS 148.51]|uniref:Uncharacterized protein n=1 Tax=Chaetomium globosum (strain ATCC 6205 / CBS 148.51 / DSM 1962 / NBRC 6347 / NRRL 1970) TaxID=306901 RepID=Q2GYR1_CHAGB|nr:uncharacterized protein CHGG_06893 [Chaetomium globosum CBS 148.51]EAQ85640.1 hypothetical protein CHGG_06893 [Chaetomium globosum CBS 148.51]
MIYECTPSIQMSKASTTPVISITTSSTTTNLPLRNRGHPANRQIQHDMHNTNNPKPLRIIRPAIHKPKHHGKHHPAQIPPRARQPRHQPIRMRKHMRNQCKVRPIPRLMKHRHQHHQPNHGPQIMRIQHPNHNQQHPRHHATHMHPPLLPPQLPPRHLIQHIAHDPPQRPCHKIQKPKHRGVVRCAGLPQIGEVAQVVGGQHRVDGQLAAEGAGVGGDVEEGVAAEEDGEGGVEGRGADDFFRVRGGVVEGEGCGGCGGGGGGFGEGFFEVGRGAVAVAGFADGGGGAGGFAWWESRNSKAGGKAYHVSMGVSLTQQQQADAAGDQAHQRHDKGDAPCLVGAVPPPMDKRIIHGRHDKVGDAAAGVAPTAREGVGGTDHVLVEPAGAPDLAGDKGAAQDSDKEADDVEPRRVLDQRRQPDGDAAHQQQQAEYPARAKLVAERASHEPDRKRGYERDDVGGLHRPVSRSPTKGGKVYQAQNDSMKPSHEKKKTRPWASMGFRMGTLRAFLFTGLTVGVRQRSDTWKPIVADAVAQGSSS